jgi:hypothetical protein
MKANLNLEVTTNKNEYRIGEEIVVRAYLFNFDDEPILVNARMALSGATGPGELSLEIVGPSQRRLPFRARVNIGLPNAEEFSTVAPWCCVGRQFDDIQAYFQVSQIGHYTLVATYRNKHAAEDTDKEIWQGTLKSNSVPFAVTEG